MRQISRGEELRAREMNDAVTATTQQIITSIPRTHARTHTAYVTRRRWFGIIYNAPSVKRSARLRSPLADRRHSSRKYDGQKSTYRASRAFIEFSRFKLLPSSALIVHRSKIAAKQKRQDTRIREITREMIIARFARKYESIARKSLVEHVCSTY